MKDYINYEYYLTTYCKLVDKALLERGLDKTKFPNIYLEKHHIMPKCIGGSEEEVNFVLLTPREHIIAHMLLCRICPNEPKLFCAVDYMLNINNRRKKKIRISARLAEYYRLSWYEKRKTISNIIGRNISKATKGKKRGPMSKEGYNKWIKHIKYGIDNPTFGTSATVETREKQSKLKKGHPRNWKFKEESLIKLSKTNSGHSQGKKVLGPDGTVYNTLRLCAESNNITIGILRNWIKNHPEKGYQFTGEYSEIINGRKRVLGPDGTVYVSVKEAAITLGKSRKAIRNWCNNNKYGFSFLE